MQFPPAEIVKIGELISAGTVCLDRPLCQHASAVARRLLHF